MSENNWRIPTDAGDYFSNQKKTLQNESRRPVVRRASDLVGPAINRFTARVTDYNSALVAVNGFVSSLPETLPGEKNAPPATPGFGTFVGTISTDAEKGGTQDLTELGTGIKWSRQFVRNPTDPDLLIFTSWVTVFNPLTVWTPEWTTLAPLSGWSGTMQFTKDQSGFLHFHGEVTRGSGTSTDLATLPVGARPTRVHRLLARTGTTTALALVSVWGSGAIQVGSGYTTGQTLTLEGLAPIATY